MLVALIWRRGIGKRMFLGQQRWWTVQERKLVTAIHGRTAGACGVTPLITSLITPRPNQSALILASVLIQEGSIARSSGITTPASSTPRNLVSLAYTTSRTIHHRTLQSSVPAAVASYTATPPIPLIEITCVHVYRWHDTCASLPFIFDGKRIGSINRRLSIKLLIFENERRANIIGRTYNECVKQILGVTQRHRIMADNGWSSAYPDKNRSPSLATRSIVLIKRIPFRSFALKRSLEYLFTGTDKISRRHMLYRLVVTLYRSGGV